MAPDNVETLRAAHDNWNRRDFADVIRNAAEGLVYTDTAGVLTSTVVTTSGSGPKHGLRPSRMPES